MKVQQHGHFTGQTAAPIRAICPGCGRVTAVHRQAGYLWCHDRFNIATKRRELCPGYGYMPETDSWAWFARGVQ